jgi:hypothetical protein
LVGIVPYQPAVESGNITPADAGRITATNAEDELFTVTLFAVLRLTTKKAWLAVDTAGRVIVALAVDAMDCNGTDESVSVVAVLVMDVEYRTCKAAAAVGATSFCNSFTSAA